MSTLRWAPPRLSVCVRPVAAACSIVAGCTAWAQGAPGLQAQATNLREVTVTSTRTVERADAVPTDITVIDDRRIQRAQPIDETGLFADEPGVDVPRDRRRYGAGNVNIRGIEDNRVLQRVDGVRLPDYYNGGGPSNISSATRDAPEFFFLKRVEVLRGPASSLYGSDAIGGVVSYVTKDPSDFLLGRAVGGQLGLSWNGADDGFGQAGAIAAGNSVLQGALMVAHRKSSELDTMGTDDSTSVARTRPNPQDAKAQAWLGKLVATPATGHRLEFAYEQKDNDTFTDVRRLSSSLPLLTSATGTEDQHRDRVSLEYEWTPTNAFVDRFTALAYTQTGETKTVTNQVRSTTSTTCSATTRGTNVCDVQLDFAFKQRSRGFSLQGDKSFATGEVVHRLIAGVDYALTATEEMRDAVVYNRTRNTTTKSLAGENFPAHDFPKGESRQAGLFLQDELAFLDGRLTVTPGLRYDRYKLAPEHDPVYESSAVRPAVSQENSAVTPRLATLWKATDTVSLWAQYVHGFRAPNYQEVNGSFRNTTQGYGAAPNPDLEPEKSRSFEVGMRYGREDVQGSFSVFDNRYKDFIEQVLLSCPSDPQCIAGLRSTYQNRNQNRVRIYGAEWRAAWRVARGWTLDAAVAWARGNNEETGQPINSVSPLRGAAGVTWEPVAGRGLSLRWRGAEAVKRTDDTSTAYFKPAGYGVADLQGWWNLTRNVSVSLALQNLFDKKYFLWGDIRQAGVTASEPGKDFYSQPGRALAATLNVTF